MWLGKGRLVRGEQSRKELGVGGFAPTSRKKVAIPYIAEDNYMVVTAWYRLGLYCISAGCQRSKHRSGATRILTFVAALRVTTKTSRHRHTNVKGRAHKRPSFSHLRVVVRVCLLVDGERVRVQLDEVERLVVPLGRNLHQPINHTTCTAVQGDSHFAPPPLQGEPRRQTTGL